jgi:hypothetical protein
VSIPILTGVYGDPTSSSCAPDAGWVPDAGVVCDETLEVDAATGTVTERYLLDGHAHVVRYRRSALRQIPRE